MYIKCIISVVRLGILNFDGLNYQASRFCHLLIHNLEGSTTIFRFWPYIEIRSGIPLGWEMFPGSNEHPIRLGALGNIFASV